MNTTFLQKILLLAGFTLVSATALAAGPPVQNQFAGGQPARASEVNANFQELADRIDAIPGATVYDYRDFGSSHTTKIYNLKGDFGTACGTGATEERTYTRTPVTGGTQIVVTRQRKDSASAICHWTSFTYLATPTEISLTRKNYYDTSGTLQSTDAMDPPVLVRTASMAAGSTFGSGSEVTKTPVAGTPVLNDVIINAGTTLGLDDVSVTAGSYTGCLKLHTSRQSNTSGNFSRVSWYCSGAGEVKRVQKEAIGEFRIWELATLTP